MICPMYELPEPPPYNEAWTIDKKREEVILAALCAGKDAATAKAYSLELYPESDRIVATEKYRRDLEEWDSREIARTRVQFPAWWPFGRTQK